MKSKKILITIFILIAALLIGTIKVQAASVNIEASKKTVEVGDEVTITAKFTAAAWNIKVSGSGISGASYAAQTSDLSEAENVKTFKLDTSKAGTYTITISGDITDANGETKEVSQSCTVIVNEKTVTPKPEPETPTTPDTKPETETPTKPTELEFTAVNETVYAKGTVNVRESYSASSNSLGQLKEGDSVTRIGVSKNAVEGYYWSKVTYNGKTVYVISSKLTTTKPTEETPQEETPTQEPKEQDPVEKPTTVDENNDEKVVKDGLKSLEIEGITLTPAFSTDVYEYRAIVKKDMSELAINAIAASEGATVTIAGNKIAEGENLIAIVVYNAKGEVEATYQISVNKNTLDLSITDAILKNGTLTAKKERTIYITIFTISFVGLIVVMILRNRIANSEDDNQEDFENSEEFTQNEETVENTEKITLTNEQIEQIMQSEILQESVNKENIPQESEQQEILQETDEIAEQEIRRPRREKRKGKHF